MLKKAVLALKLHLLQSRSKKSARKKKAVEEKISEWLIKLISEWFNYSLNQPINQSPNTMIKDLPDQT
jgi:hypothetical protein